MLSESMERTKRIRFCDNECKYREYTYDYNEIHEVCDMGVCVLCFQSLKADCEYYDKHKQPDFKISDELKNKILSEKKQYGIEEISGDIDSLLLKKVDAKSLKLINSGDKDILYINKVTVILDHETAPKEITLNVAAKIVDIIILNEYMNENMRLSNEVVKKILEKVDKKDD